MMANQQFEGNTMVIWDQWADGPIPTDLVLFLYKIIIGYKSIWIHTLTVKNLSFQHNVQHTNWNADGTVAFYITEESLWWAVVLRKQEGINTHRTATLHCCTANMYCNWVNFRRIVVLFYLCSHNLLSSVIYNTTH